MGKQSLKDQIKNSASTSTQKAVEVMIQERTKHAEIQYVDPRILIDHPLQVEIGFKLPDEPKYSQMVESMRMYGILVPLNVRAVPGGIEIISGHTRKHMAINDLNLKDVPVVFGDFDDDEAEMIVSGLNEWQRDYDEALKRKMAVHQAEMLKRLRKNGKDIGKGKITELVGEKMGISARKVESLIKIERNLIPELKELLDKDELASQKAYELSMLDEETQRLLLKVLDKSMNEITSEKIKEISKKSEEELDSLKTSLSTFQQSTSQEMEQNKRIIEKLNSDLQKASSEATVNESEVARLTNELNLYLKKQKDINAEIQSAVSEKDVEIQSLRDQLTGKDNHIQSVEDNYKSEIERLSQALESKSVLKAKLINSNDLQMIESLLSHNDPQSALNQIWSIISNSVDITA